MDSQVVVPCGIDSQLAIQCNPGDLNIFFIGIDRILPIVTLLNPCPSCQVTSGVVMFDYSVTDANPIENCSIYLNGNLEQTDSSITRNTIQSFIVTNMIEDDNLKWQINCTDQFNNQGNSTIRYLDTKPSGDGGGGGGIDVPKEIDKILCNITYDLSRKNQTSMEEIMEIVDLYYELTNKTVAYNTVKIYVEGWDSICKEEKKPIAIIPLDESTASVLIWYLLILTLIVSVIMLYVYKKKKILILLGWKKKKKEEKPNLQPQHQLDVL